MAAESELRTTSTEAPSNLAAEIQSHGLKLESASFGAPSRKGGAGPSDHRTVTVNGQTIMAPVLTHMAQRSPLVGRLDPGGKSAVVYRDGEKVGLVTFPPRPHFYDMETAEGVPYWKIAQLHSTDVLATTVLQHCIRYPDVKTRCQFCAIGESLKGGRTIAEKTPEQLAEVAEAAWRFDGVTQMVMTTGTPKTDDRGAAVLSDCAAAITRRTPIPIQGQCEPPVDYAWFGRMKDAGISSIGMHLEAWDIDVRRRIMPGKAKVPIEEYLRAYRAAVEVFGRGEVSTYLLAGLGDSRESLLAGCRQLIDIGVYPFVVPFVPITGTQLEHHPAPSAKFMVSVLEPLGAMLRDAGMTSDTLRSGCAKCGACSSLSAFEKQAKES
jgi:radical SAM protein (TIGR04043 family)